MRNISVAPPRAVAGFSFWSVLPILLGVALVAAAWIASPLLPEQYASLAVVAPFAVILALAMAVKPEIALWVTVFYIPFESDEFRPLDLPESLSVVKILGLILLGAFLFNVVFRRRPFRLLDDHQDYALLLLAAVLLFSGVTSLLPDKTISATARLVRLFAFYFAVKNLVTSPGQVKSLMWAILGSGVFASVFGLNEFFQARYVRVHDIRVGGVYMDPNQFAAAMVVVVVVGLYLIPISRRALQVVIAGGVGVVVVAVLLSASRSGILALGVVLLLYVWRHPRRWQLLLALAVLVAVTFPIWPASVTDRLFGDLDGGSRSLYAANADYSAQRRASYVEFSNTLVVGNPVMGVGYGTFAHLYPRSEFAWFDNAMRDSERIRVAHNTYLEIVVGAGVIGLVAYLLLLFVSWRDLRRTARIAPRGSVIWAAANAFELALIGIMISNLFLSIQHFKYMWLTIGLASALAYLARRMTAQDPVERKPA
ncbi:MAG: hypothetical protein Kow00120_13560 [Anaerolineae bacterium]